MKRKDFSLAIVKESCVTRGAFEKPRGLHLNIYCLRTDPSEIYTCFCVVAYLLRPRPKSNKT